MFGIFHGRPPALTAEPLSGRDAVVTGASAGIGLETARSLAMWGARVTVVGRSPERTARAAEEITRSARERGVSAPDIAPMICDFASLTEVRKLADKILERHTKLHILVNNAGLWLQRQQPSTDGHESTFAVNHLAPFLLTTLLRDRMIASAPARVVTVSSRLHTEVRSLEVERLAAPPRFSGIGAYRCSKLCNVLFARELAERLKGTGVTSNALHPGDIATDVTRDNRVLSFLSDRLGRPFLLTPEEGSRTTVHVATHAPLLEVTGRYFAVCKEAPASKLTEDAGLRARLWEISEALTRS